MTAESLDEQTIAERMVFNLTAPEAPPVPVTVDLVYASSDPFVVQATFHSGTQTRVEWVLARDLLAEGLHRTAGVGDVRVQPAPRDRSMVQLELSSPSGWAVFTTSADELREFLNRSYATVPAGAETSRLDIDLALAALLNR